LLLLLLLVLPAPDARTGVAVTALVAPAMYVLATKAFSVATAVTATAQWDLLGL